MCSGDRLVAIGRFRRWGNAQFAGRCCRVSVENAKFTRHRTVEGRPGPAADLDAALDAARRAARAAFSRPWIPAELAAALCPYSVSGHRRSVQQGADHGLELIGGDLYGFLHGSIVQRTVSAVIGFFWERFGSRRALSLQAVCRSSCPQGVIKKDVKRQYCHMDQ